MTDAEVIAALDRALAEEEAVAARLRAADVALVEAEERAEDEPDDETLRAGIGRCAAASAAAAAEVVAARGRRQDIESGMHRDDVLDVIRRRYRLVRRGATA
jgi:hypothetical protein